MSELSLIRNHDCACRKTIEFYHWLLKQSLPGVTFAERYSLGFWNQFKKSDVFDCEISVSKVGFVNGSISFCATLVESDKPFTLYLWKYFGGDETDCHQWKSIRFTSLDELLFQNVLVEVISFFNIKKNIQLSLF